MSEDEVMSKEAFNEIIDNLEYIGTVTDYKKKGIKYNLKKLQEELQQEKEKNIIYQANGSNVKLELHIKKNYISKNKIRAVINKLKNEPDTNKLITTAESKLNTIIILENLLEE